MTRTITLTGERYDARGRKTGESPVTLWRAGGHRSEMAPDVLLTVGDRQVYVNAADLRAAVEHLVSVADLVGITYRAGARVEPCGRCGEDRALHHEEPRRATDCPGWTPRS